MSCRLCRGYDENSIPIFSEKGKELKICQTIEKYFWFKVDENDCFSLMVCKVCWGKVLDFDKFYKEVEIANELFEVTIKVEPDCTEFIADSEENPKNVDNLAGDPLVNDGTVVLNESIDNPEDAEGSAEESSTDYELSGNDKSDSENESEPEVKKQRKTLKKVANTNQKKGRKKGSKNKKKKNEEKDDEQEQKEVKEYENRDSIIARYMELKCEICGLSMPKFCKLKKHMQDEHDTKGYAICCSKKFAQKFTLVNHVLSHLNPEIFKCQDCNRSFVNETCLKRHLDVKHKSEEEKIFECPDCHKKFPSELILETHRIMHQEKKFDCDLCPKRFPSSARLKTHIRQCHSQNKHMCDNCGKVFAGSQAFKIHLMEHSSDGSKRVQCDVCHVWYKNIVLLANHKRTHLDTTVHECDICGKISASRRALLAHKNFVHSTDPKFECTICNKSFKKALNLKEHIALHTGEVLYRCPHCPKTFNSNANMHSHRKKVHPTLFEKFRKDRMVNGITEENKLIKHSALVPTLLKSFNE